MNTQFTVQAQDSQLHSSGIKLSKATQINFISDLYYSYAGENSNYIVGYGKSKIIFERSDQLFKEIYLKDLHNNISTLIEISKEAESPLLEVAYVSSNQLMEVIAVVNFSNSGIVTDIYSLNLNSTNIQVISLDSFILAKYVGYLINYKINTEQGTEYVTLFWLPEIGIIRTLKTNLMVKSVFKSDTENIFILLDNSYRNQIIIKSTDYEFDIIYLNIKPDEFQEVTLFTQKIHESTPEPVIKEYNKIIVNQNHLILVGIVREEGEELNILLSLYKKNTAFAQLVSESIIRLKNEQYVHQAILMKLYSKYRSHTAIIISGFTITSDPTPNGIIRTEFPIIFEVQMNETGHFDLMWFHKELQGSKYIASYNQVEDKIEFKQEFRIIDDYQVIERTTIISTIYIFTANWSNRNTSTQSIDEYVILLSSIFLLLVSLIIFSTKIKHKNK